MALEFHSKGTRGALLAIRRVKIMLADPTAGKVFGSQCVGTAGAGANPPKGPKKSGTSEEIQLSLQYDFSA